MLEQQIQQDIMAAMKAHQTTRLESLRAIKAAILLAKTSGANVVLTDADIVKIMQKQVKQRRESADMYIAAGRKELADVELAQAACIEEYLPQQLSADELDERVKAIIAQTGATSMAQMGRVMGVASKELNGLADGKQIAETVKKLLS